MATLYFKVESDLQKVKDLRAEISRLEAQMKSFGRNSSIEEIKHTEERLTAAKSKFTELATEAAKAGAAMESGFKKKVYEASQVINGYTEKIIEQKSVIKGVESDVRKLTEAYGRAVKNKSPRADSILQELNASKAALNEEKAALFSLTQEQAKARLSVKKLRDEYAAFKGSSKGMTDMMGGIEDQIKKWGAGLLAGYGIKEFVSQVIRVRGEFQQMETSIKTLVGESKANELIPQIKEMAKVSPLTMSDIVGAEQMMLGFNIAADDTVKYLRALSDVSMGNSQKFNSLTLAFSQMSAAGKLMGQDFNQMVQQGFNPLQQISERTGKSIAQLKKEMSAGAISAEMVQQAFIDATSAGGKFYKMSEEGSKTINGQISMMQDAMDNALNEIGKSSEGLIMTGIKGVTTLIENYETVGVVLTGLVAAYGTYKAALVINIALEKAAAVARLASIKNTSLLAAATGVLTGKIAALNAVMALNPYALITAGVLAAAAGAIWLTKKITDNASAVKKTKDASEEYTKTIDEQYEQAESLMAIIHDETKSQQEKVKVYNQLKTLVPQITKLYSMEKLAALGLAEANKILQDSKGKDIEAGIKAEMQSYQKIVDYYDKSINRLKSSGFKKRAQEMESTEDYQNAKKELERLKALNEEVEEAAKAPQVKNKEYWVKVKKDAESAKEAMDVSLKGSEDWVKLEQKAAAAQKEIDKYSTSKTTKTESDANKQDAKKKETLAKIQESKKAVIDAEREVQFEIRQASINAMKEGTDKELAQINLDYDRKIAENEKRKEQFIKDAAELKAMQWELDNPGAVKKGQSFDKSKVTEADLTPQQKAILDFYDALAVKEKEIAEAQSYKDLLDKYKTYLQQRKEIQDKFAKDRAAMKTPEGEWREEAGFSKATEDENRRQEQEALNELDVQFAMRDEQFQTWANQIANMSLKKLRDLLQQARQELGQMERENAMAEKMGVSPKYSPEQMAKARAKVVKAEKAIKDADVSDADKDWKDLYRTLNDIADQFDEIGQLVGGTAGEIMSLAGNVASGIISMIDGVKAVGKTGAEALSTVEKASVILAIIGTAIKLVTKIVKLASELHDKKHEERIKKLQSQVDKLEKSYDRLGDAIDNAYSTDAAEKLREANDLLEQQYKLIIKQKQEENLKKNPDQDRLAEWDKELEDIGIKLEENRIKAADAILGEDIKSAIENFAEAYADALSSSENKWVSVKDTAKNMMKQMVVESIKATLKSSNAIEKMRSMLLTYYQDGVLSLTEQNAIYKMAEDVQKELDAKYGWAEDLFKDDKSAEQEATYGGFESMSEETGSELNGRFTALQMAGEEIKNQGRERTISLAEINGSLKDLFPQIVEGRVIVDEIRSILATSLLELQGINENTSANVKELKRLGVMFNKWDSKIMNL